MYFWAYNSVNYNFKRFGLGDDSISYTSVLSKLHALLLMNYDFIIFISLCLHFDVLVVKVHFIVL